MKIYLCLVVVGLAVVNANPAKLVRKNEKSNDELSSLNSVNQIGEDRNSLQTLTKPLVEAKKQIDRIIQLLEASNVDGSLNKQADLGKLLNLDDLVALLERLLSPIVNLLGVVKGGLGISDSSDSTFKPISSLLPLVESAWNGLTSTGANPKLNGLNSLLKTTGSALQDSTHGSQSGISSLSHQKQDY